MESISEKNATVYFHNLKFDGAFILDWLLKNDYEHTTDQRDTRNGTFKSLISDMGQFYSITVRWENGCNTEFRDSRKKIPLSVAGIAEAFGMATTKGEIDYDAQRPIGHVMSEEERDYLRLDVTIVATALAELYESGMVRLTQASDALAEYKRVFGTQGFTKVFPVLSEYMDSEIRRAYRGGFTYCDPRTQGRKLGGGIVLDVNSLYPSVMWDDVLPYGEPEFVKGIVKPTENRPLTIFSITFVAKIKPNHIPCIQIKGNSRFGETEYLTEIKEPVTIMVTNVDWALYNDHYNITVIEYGGGWRFYGTRGMFADYIGKWRAVKEAATGGRREIAKLYLNSLYGKLASNPNVTSKIPTLDGDQVKLELGEAETRAPVYTAAAVFITSYARNLTIRAAQMNYDMFAYADTDSLHLLTNEVPANMDIHPTRFGAWDHEYTFENAYYIRAKAYLLYGGKPGYETPRYKTRFAGLPAHVSGTLTFDDMVPGKTVDGKLRPKTVPGGVVLVPTPFDLGLR